MALSGKREHAAHGYATLYAYGLLCMSCYLAFLGAPPLTVVAIALLLAVPNIASLDRYGVLSMAALVHVVNALIFTSLAHIVGRGIAALGSGA
jgi:hypothetical protein